MLRLPETGVHTFDDTVEVSFQFIIRRAIKFQCLCQLRVTSEKLVIRLLRACSASVLLRRTERRADLMFP